MASLGVRRFALLFAAGMIGAIAIVPYQLSLLAPPPGLSVEALVVAGLIQSAVLVGIAVAAGAWLAPRAGLGTPLLDAALAGEPTGARVRAIAPVALALGAAASVAVLALDVLVFAPQLTDTVTAPSASPPRWSGALAALYGGITEELLLRYCVMSFLAWLLTRATRAPAAYWVAIFGAALLFGLGHLPATAQLLPLTPVVVTRALLLNGLAGIAFGWLYWRHGLEAAMLGHFAGDLVLHVVAPTVLA